MQDYKTIYVVKYNNNNDFIVAPRDLRIAFDKFLSTSHLYNTDKEVNIYNTLPASTSYTPVTYTFKKHYKNGPWYEFKNSSNGPQSWYEPTMNVETSADTWYEIQPLHFYLNKMDNAANFTRKRTTSSNPRRTTSSSHRRNISSINNNSEKQIQVFKNKKWIDATRSQKEAYHNFFKNVRDVGGPFIAYNNSGRRIYFFRWNRNNKALEIKDGKSEYIGKTNNNIYMSVDHDETGWMRITSPW